MTDTIEQQPVTELFAELHAVACALAHLPANSYPRVYVTIEDPFDLAGVVRALRRSREALGATVHPGNRAILSVGAVACHIPADFLPGVDLLDVPDEGCICHTVNVEALLARLDWLGAF